MGNKEIDNTINNTINNESNPVATPCSTTNRTVAQQVRRYLLIALGLAILNFAYVMVTVPHGIINGGVTSFSMILARLPFTDALPVNAWVAIVTAILAALCCIFLGRDIFVASIYSCAVGVAAFNFFTLIVPAKAIDAMIWFGQFGPIGEWTMPDGTPVITVGLALELIAAAIVVGAGYYFCLSNDSTAVGMDTIALILHKRNEKIPVAYAMYAINIIVLLLGLYTYGLRCVIMGILFAGIQAKTLDTMLGFRQKQKAVKE